MEAGNKTDIISTKRLIPHILVDTREQLPFKFGDYDTPTLLTTIKTGDYSIGIKLIRKERSKLIEYAEKMFGAAYLTPETLKEIIQENGKYSIIIKFDKEISIERKSLDDITSVISEESTRARFEESVKRGSLLKYYAVFIEASEMDVIAHRYTSRIIPQAVIDTCIRWSVKYRVPIIFCDNRINAEYHTFEALMGFLDYKKGGLL
jgi:ERCC4-type nuclease